MVYTDHKNCVQDILGLTSNRVYQWRLLLEECGPNIMNIKGMHNTVANAISWLDYNHVSNDEDKLMTFTKCWCHYIVHPTQAQNNSNIQNLHDFGVYQ